jgi:hypothetical protein
MAAGCGKGEAKLKILSGIEPDAKLLNGKVEEPWTA